MLKGNHEEYSTSKGISQKLLDTLPEKEKDHYKWTRTNLSEKNIEFLDKLQYQKILHFNDINIRFQHFAIEDERISEYSIYKHGIENTDFDKLFNVENDIIIFGHTHAPIDIIQRKRYLCFGASGCTGKYNKNKSAIIIDFDKPSLEIIKIELEWDQKLVQKELIRRSVPDKELIMEYFMN